MFLGWLPPEWIKQLLRNPLLRKTLHLRKRKLTCCHLLFERTFYSAIPFIALLVVLYFYYPVNSRLPHKSKNIVFCASGRSRTHSLRFWRPLHYQLCYTDFCTPGQIRTVATYVKSILLYQLSYEGVYFPSYLRGYYCLYFRFIFISF